MKSEIEMAENRIMRRIDKIESSLRTEIRESERVILDKVGRVHGTLDTHKTDKSRHTA